MGRDCASNQKTKAPRSALLAFACAPSGAARVDRSTTGRWSGVSLRLDLFTSPVSPFGVAGDAAFGLDTGFPASNPLAPFHADPVARALGPGAMEPTSLSPVGVAPVPSAPHHDSVACTPPPVAPKRTRRFRATRHPKVSSVPGCLADPLAGCGLPRALRSFQQASVSAATRRRHRPGLTRRPPRLPVTLADSSLPPTSRRSSPARSEVAVNTVHAPIPLSPRERRGLGRSPLLTAPVGVRSPERGSVKSLQNPRSRGILKFTGLSPELSCYPQDSFCRPPPAHRSCTVMCTAGR